MHKIMNSDLGAHINIGKDTERRLLSVGVDSFAALKKLGSKKAFLLLQTLDPGACLDLLYGLEGAIQDVKWNELDEKKKEELRLFHQKAKKI